MLNKSWKTAVTTVCDEIREALAPGARKVNAKLYKLLMYCEDDFFKMLSIVIGILPVCCSCCQ